MQYQEEPVAKRTEGNLVEYVCPVCGGWDRLCEVYRAFLPFIDHLIQDLCLKEHPKLQQPFLVGHYLWFRIPGGDEIIHGLRSYVPNAPEWKVLLEKGEKILPQAKLFLLDIADWLEKALASIEQLNAIVQSDLLVAEQLVELVKGLPDEFHEQREYLLQHEDKLKDTGMDPKWRKSPGRQATFVAGSMAGARWGLTPSTSREFVRQVRRNPRGPRLRTLKIEKERYWWEPEAEG